ncbi:hypothetical protein H9Y05_09850 [Crocinitomicaceae bacterium CZZ-1]|uniref:Uncharacterized protein n=1 Tax=Taishania pollutisoli TaxID=2766479 RepID=A0A8J6TTG2_9FLAO|nr:hypothetical protein [Taishania pollutisoli]MBC9812774.1 hypothetical protein [Taishania pollutisoli]
MPSNYLKEISTLNKIDLKEIKGHRLYYSVYKSVISLIFSFVLIISSVFLIIMRIDNNAITLLGFLALLLFLYEIQYPIGRLMLKNPIFILDQGKLYYLEYNKWYDITEYQFSEEIITNHNLSQSYCMTDKNNYRIFAENNWFFHAPENFKSKVRYQRLIKIGEKRKLASVNIN